MEKALREAAHEALPELEEQLRLVLSGESIKDRVDQAWQEAD